MKTLTFFITILVAVLPLLIASQSSWSRITPTPQENHINDITIIPGTDKIIAICDGSTIMISEDLGETWELIYNPGGMANHVPFRTVYFYNASTGYIGGRYYESNADTYIYYILKTTDGGITWSVNTNLPGTGYQEVNGFYFVSPETGFVPGYHGKLLKTTDAGENWFDIESGVSFTLNSIDFFNDSSGYIVGSSIDSVLKTNDYGNTWTKEVLNSPLSDGSLQEIQFTSNNIGYISQNFGNILKTSNAGETWNIVFTDDNINTYTLDFSDSNHGIAGCYQDLMQSCIISTNDGGTSWSVFTLPEFQVDNYSVCCINESNFVFGGYMGMIYKSSNGSQSWEPKFSRNFWGNIYRYQNLDQNISFCLASNRLDPFHKSVLYKSEDGGENFTELLSIPVADYNLQTKAAFHFLDQDNGHLTYYHYENLLKVFKTTDGGNSWSEIESGNFDLEPYAIKFYDEQHGLISGLGFILKTSDGGFTWEEVYSFYLFYDLMDIHYFNANEIFVAGGGYTYSALIKSYDGGDTWEEMYMGYYGTIYDMEMINNNVIYLACGDNTILKSPDGGDTWQFTQIINPNNIEFHAVHFPSESIGYAVGSGPYEIMVKTTDGGNTWNVIHPQITAGLNAVHFYDENTGFVYGEKGIVLKTTNGGTTFMKDMPGIENSSSLNIYPNPCNAFLTLNYILPEGIESGTIEIFNSVGKKVSERRINKSNGRESFQVESLKQGIYLVTMKHKNTLMETKKMLKLK